MEAISAEAVTTSEIEGEILDRASVQSSIRRQLGLASDNRRIGPAEQGIAEMIEAPPPKDVLGEMARSVRWFNGGAPGGAPLPALTRAGIAHLYFISIILSRMATAASAEQLPKRRWRNVWVNLRSRRWLRQFSPAERRITLRSKRRKVTK